MGLVVDVEMASERFLNAAGAQASTANVGTTHGVAFANAHLFQIWHPATLAQIMRVADVVTHLRTFTAYVTSFRHALTLLCLLK